MKAIKAYAALSAEKPLEPWQIDRREPVGSLVGGIKETQEMLDYCADHNISSDIELINMNQINEAYERTLAGDVHYRFVIDMKSLN